MVPIWVTLLLCFLANAHPAPVNLANEASHVSMVSNGEYIVIVGGKGPNGPLADILVLGANGSRVSTPSNLTLSLARFDTALAFIQDEVSHYSSILRFS